MLLCRWRYQRCLRYPGCLCWLTASMMSLGEIPLCRGNRKAKPGNPKMMLGATAIWLSSLRRTRRVLFLGRKRLSRKMSRKIRAMMGKIQ